MGLIDKAKDAAQTAAAAAAGWGQQPSSAAPMSAPAEPSMAAAGR